MAIGNVRISFPKFGVVRFHLSCRPWDYLDCDRARAAHMLRLIKSGMFLSCE